MEDERLERYAMQQFARWIVRGFDVYGIEFDNPQLRELAESDIDLAFVEEFFSSNTLSAAGETPGQLDCVTKKKDR